MTEEKHRYVQPQNVHDAMQLIQHLFNEYRNAPLTQELLAYHLNLVKRLQSDILQAAKAEGDPKQLAALQSMTAIMQSWSPIRLANRPFPGKMRHFKLDTGPAIHFKRKVHKINGGHNHRASRH
ncbi:hypothetical protein [Limosilactobacillus secaliphilus]|uniref:Uncharacterized protein n=1 Tax=Limosilactobacillus secaliphilus TaxID=396268 RepID=A0A0R2I182_9LACO|nr:hypothetical protein [Limosilactobacillus secaliphilus]KRN58776.1 hypothetical protein IV45_GL000401 [Limosilactobacillus secaliphilus]